MGDGELFDRATRHAGKSAHFYLEQVEGEQQKLFLGRFDQSFVNLKNEFADVQETTPALLMQLLKLEGPEKESNLQRVINGIEMSLQRLSELRKKNRVSVWKVSKLTSHASFYLASNDPTGEGQIRLHSHAAESTFSSTLLHEATHASHALLYPQTNQLYAKVKETGKYDSRDELAKLYRYKAWSEYWAYRRTFELNVMTQGANMVGIVTLPHKRAINMDGYKKAAFKVRPGPYNPLVKDPGFS